MDQQLLSEVKSEYQNLLERGKLADALPLIMQAANWADFDSQVLAERILLHGQYGHQITPEAGAQVARLAAMNGDVQSMYDLYLLAMASRDETRAIYWLKKAANSGFAQAQDALGMAYLQAKGVERNPQLAKEWFEKALEGGLQSASKHLQMADALIAKMNKRN